MGKAITAGVGCCLRSHYLRNTFLDRHLNFISYFMLIDARIIQLILFYTLSYYKNTCVLRYKNSKQRLKNMNIWHRGWTWEMYWLIEIKRKKSSWGRKKSNRKPKKELLALHIKHTGTVECTLESKKVKQKQARWWRHIPSGPALWRQMQAGSLNLRPTWTTECVPDQSWLCREILS